MTDPGEFMARYRSAVQPTEDQLRAVWEDVSDPGARPRVVQPRPSARPRRRGALAIAGAALAVAAAAFLAWCAGGITGDRSVENAAGVQAPLQHERDDDTRAVETISRGRGRASETAVIEPEAHEVVEPATAPRGATTSRAEALDATPAAKGTRRRTRPAADAVEPSSDPASADTLAAELRLIERAEVLLRQERPAPALGVLQEHRDAFPHGELELERRALRVVALCLSGKAEQGHSEAASLSRETLSKPYRERIQSACDEP